MFIKDTKLDEHHSQRESTFESREELAQVQRIKPWPVPSTHVYEYSYVDPTPVELAKNPALMPKLVEGVRELSLAEIGAKSKNFDTLTLAELRWLADRHKVAMPAYDKSKPKQSDQDAIKDALRLFVKGEPPPAKTVKAAPAPTDEPVRTIVVPEDIAKMDMPSLKTEAAKLEVYDAFIKLSGKSLPYCREFLARERLKKADREAAAKELVTA